jgi:hypothetical protein
VGCQTDSLHHQTNIGATLAEPLTSKDVPSDAEGAVRKKTIELRCPAAI